MKLKSGQETIFYGVTDQPERYGQPDINKQVALSLARDHRIKDALLQIGWMPPCNQINDPVLTGTRWKHVKTGGIYQIVGQCWLEATRKPAILYYSEEKRMVWARDKDEFLDGRFEPVENKKKGWFSKIMKPWSR